MRLFDTHCHLQDPAFRDDLHAVIQRAEAAGLAGVVVCGYDPESNLAALDIARLSPVISPAAGIHPHDAKDTSGDVFRDLEQMAALPEVVAVGEIGLDFYRDHSPHDVQRSVLDRQLEIAVRVGKPVSVHTRAAEDAVYDQLRDYAAASPLPSRSRPAGVMHCFGGTVEQALRYVALGFLISIPCTVTYPRNEQARSLARELPLDRLVIETDSPYLPPQAHRGRRNEPAYAGAAAGGVAAARGISVEAAAEATTRNAARLFGIPIPALAGKA